MVAAMKRILLTPVPEGLWRWAVLAWMAVLTWFAVFTTGILFWIVTWAVTSKSWPR